ncbi:MAG: phosphatidylglycerol lysyltransferase domain-containing protein [Cyanobacteriota bacterium]
MQENNLLHQRVSTTEKLNSLVLPTYEKNWIHGVAITLYVLGIVNILSSLLSYTPSRLLLLKEVFEYQLILGSRFIVLVTGIIAILVAPALYRRKRVAWYISVIILGCSGFAHIIKNIDVTEASVCILLLGIILPLFKYCSVKSDPLRTRQGWKLLLTTLAFIIIYTFLGIQIFASELGFQHNDIPFLSVWFNALLFDVSDLNPHGHAATFFTNSLLWINGFALISGTILALSPVIGASIPEKNLDLSKSIASEHAIQPVQSFILRKDYQHYLLQKDVFKGFMGYKISNGVAMGIGNPCANSDPEELLNEWINFCIQHDWIPAIYQAKEDIFPILKKINFEYIPIGVEAVVNLETFTLKGKTMQKMRSALNKIEKSNWVVREYKDSDWVKIEKLNQQWLDIHGEKEIGFAMGTASPDYLLSTRSMLLVDQEDNLLAYVNNVDLNGNNGRTIDLMRRSVDSPTGAMESLIVSEIVKAQEDGKAYYDLGFSPLAQIDETFTDNKIAVKLLKLIYDHQKRFYDFQGLHRFKSKYNPDWQYSYLVYPSALHLPKVLFALLQLNRKYS